MTVLSVIGPVGAAPVLAGEVTAAEVQMADVAFSPAEVHVKAGETVTWRDADVDIEHTVTADDKSFDSSPLCGSAAAVPKACMGKDDTFTMVFARPGRFPYFCRLHGGPGGEGMAGVVVVD